MVFTGRCRDLATEAAALRCAETMARARTGAYVGQRGRTTVELFVASRGEAEQVWLDAAFSANADFCDRFGHVRQQRAWRSRRGYAAEVGIAYSRSQLDQQVLHLDRHARQVAERLRLLSAAPLTLAAEGCGSYTPEIAAVAARGGLAVRSGTGMEQSVHELRVNCRMNSEPVGRSSLFVGRAELAFSLMHGGGVLASGSAGSKREVATTAQAAQWAALETVLNDLPVAIAHALTGGAPPCGHSFGDDQP